MLKNYIFLTLVALAPACGDKNRHNDSVPTPASQPIVPADSIAPADLTVPLDVIPQIVETPDLASDFGFTAIYSNFGPVWTKTKGGDTVVRVKKNRIQLRKLDSREILDCRYDEKTLPISQHILDGHKQKSDTFTLLSCIIMRQLTWPIANREALCQAYGCIDEKIDEFETTKVLMETPLWLEKTSNLRIQGDSELRMLKKIPGIPAEQDFDYEMRP
ncbi:MAG TPA: hypothetical protein VE954_34680 [Oligoflexus sp.]|uniref:hypothetical protein n=1 Tax=Oligoflexus sp. TaxID=1971216 RepID=UPI002D30EFCD|nr:hypothetical protein [Oligoflexus sp.]HYX38277.1 hypothetical protein [Oligoflexus sp.]